MPVRELHDVCAVELDWSFSSTRKTVERMIQKGLLFANTDETPSIYGVRVSKAATLSHLARDFMRRVLEVRGAVPMAVFSASPILSDDDLDEIEGLL